MNPWRRGPITTNPYVRTAFRVAGIPREMTRHRSIVQRLAELRNVLRANPRAFEIAGERVSIEEVNAAEAVLQDPRLRILEELLSHASRTSPVGVIDGLIEECQHELERRSENSSLARPDAIEAVGRRLVALYFETVESPDPLFGAAELELLPPFGSIEA